MRANDFVKVIAPLKSWDIYLHHYKRLQELANDKFLLEKMALENRWQQKFNFAEQLFQEQSSIIVTSPDLSITYVSSNIRQLTGYGPSEVIGKNPSIFQGSKTDIIARDLMRKAIETKIPFESNLINYKKNGGFYNCHIKGYPIFNKEKKLVNFIAFEKELSVSEQ